MQQSHGLRLLSSIQRSALLLISRAYRKTSTQALQILTGIIPLDLKLRREATLGSVTRHRLPVNSINPLDYDSKTSKYILHPASQNLQIENNPPRTQIELYTDGSKTEGGCGAAFCSLKQNEIIHTWKGRLHESNSVFQAELFAIKNALIWFKNSQYTSATIFSDSLSGLQAALSLQSQSSLVNDIIALAHSLSKEIHFSWVRAHVGIYGNELADQLAKDSTTLSSPSLFIPTPPSHLKKQLTESLLKEWQERWSSSEKGRYTFNFFPKVNTERLLQHRNLYIFFTNHGPFQSYLHKFNKSPSPLCVCGDLSTALHYITQCPITTRFHIKKSRSITDAQWASYVLKRPDLCKLIIDCINYIENANYVFQNNTPNAGTQNTGTSSDEE